MQQGNGRAGGAGRAGPGAGSVHEERAGELHVVEGGGEFAALAVHVGLHVGDAVVGLFPSQVLEGKGPHLSAQPADPGWGWGETQQERPCPEPAASSKSCLGQAWSEFHS